MPHRDGASDWLVALTSVIRGLVSTKEPVVVPRALDSPCLSAETGPLYEHIVILM